MLIALADKYNGGEMVKLEFRLKTLESTERKIRKLHAARTRRSTRCASMMRCGTRCAWMTSLRGNYVEAAKATLADLESKGPRGAVREELLAEGRQLLRHQQRAHGRERGSIWELQFHTTASFDAQTDTRPLYEEMRLVKTPLERKRELFDAATKRWNAVPIPKGVLEKGALHARDQVRERPRP